MVEIKKGVRLSGTERDELATRLVKEYEQGASIRSLADSTGRSYGFVHRVLTESTVKLRSRGGATRGRAKAADS